MKETRERHNYVNNYEQESGRLIFEIKKGWNSRLLSKEITNGLALQYLLSKLLKKDLKTFEATAQALVELFLF